MNYQLIRGRWTFVALIAMSVVMPAQVIGQRRRAVQQATVQPLLNAGTIDQTLGTTGTPTQMQAPQYSAQVVRFPTRPTNGLAFTIDNGWARTNGFVPVRVEVRSTRPTGFARNRKIRVGLEYHTYRGFEPTMVTSEIELAQGASVANATIRVFQQGEWDLLRVEVVENGEVLEDVSGKHSLTHIGYIWRETQDAILVIDSKAPNWDSRSTPPATWRQQTTVKDVRPLAQLAWNGIQKEPDLAGMTTVLFNPNTKYVDSDVMEIVRDHRFLGYSTIDEMSDNWLDWTCYQVVYMTWEEWNNVRDNHPQKFGALLQWNRSGGVLFISDTGTVFDRIAELETHLKLKPLPGDEKFSNWTTPTPLGAPESVMLFPTMSDKDQAYFKRLGYWLVPRPGVAKPPAQAPPLFVWRENGLGFVFAMRVKDPFSEDVQTWPWMYRSLPDEYKTWKGRFGASLNRPNDDFYNLLIPNVGLPPVNSFLVMITVFVVVIGPFNYMFLRKIKRLYLLMVTVPVGAFVITATLFGYATFGDGFSVRLRSRSYSEIDQASGSMVTISRQSYYAAFAPSSGLIFPEDSLVVPIDPTNTPNHDSDDPAGRRILWEEGQQRLIGGFMKPRQTAQFMVAHNGPTELQLGVAAETETDGTLKVRNELGSTIETLVVSHQNGKFYMGTDIAPDTVVALKETSINVPAAELGRIHTDTFPGFPQGFRRPPSSGRWLRRRINSFEAQRPRSVTSILELKMRALIINVKEKIPPRTYLAIVEDSKVVPYGISEADQGGSFHLIKGRW